MALTGNIGLVGGGLYYLHSGQTPFPLKLLNHKGPQHPNHSSHRIVSINNFASEILELEDPPVKLLWISGRNSFSQDQNINKWKTLLQQLDLVITVDLFMTATAEQSDLVLPAASPFEEYELVVSYWHHWLALNQKTLPPYFEAKSDLEIARMFTRKLNELSPGFSNFPSELTAEDWISQEFTPEVLSLYGLESWGELKDGPRKLLNAHNPWADNLFLTDSKKFEIYSAKAKKNHLPAIPRFRWTKPNQYPLRLLSPQNLSSIHSQYQWLSSFDYN
jgi:anaerobic selenocysteine-containing dehydrogenase